MTKWCRGRLRPPRPTKRPDQTNWIIEMSVKKWVMIQSRADLFHRCFADLQPRQAFVPLLQPPLPPLTEYSYLSCEAINLPQK